MRLAIFLLFILLAGCSNSKQGTNTFSAYNGTWLPIHQEIAGKELPASVFAKQQLIIEDSNYTVIAESVDKGIVHINADKMDIYGREGVNAGKHLTAIHKLENGNLVICYNLKGDSYPADFSTSGKPLFFKSVFKRQAK